MGEHADRREFRRLETAIEARFLINNDEAGRGVVRDISANGLAIKSETTADIADHVIAHLAGGMRLEGRVARKWDGGFSIALAISISRREKLKQKIDGLFNEDEPPTELWIERRVNDRKAVGDVEGVCKADNRVLRCQIVDMSLSGAAIKTDSELALGAVVTIGQTVGRVVRNDGDIYGIEFDIALNQRLVG